jgi:hypothetical protein
MGKYATLSGDMVRRGITLRTVRIIGPDGEFIRMVQPVEQDVACDFRQCRLCGGTMAVDKSPRAA